MNTRFSTLYLKPAELVKDSERFRMRLKSYFSTELYSYNEKVAELLAREHGVTVSESAYTGPSVPLFFTSGKTRDVLDAISLIFRTIKKSGYTRDADSWKNFVERCLREESLCYSIDAKGVIHYFVDPCFQNDHMSMLSVLNNPKFLGTKTAFESAYSAIESDQPDTKASVRYMFEALEIVAKDLTRSKNLNHHLMKNILKDLAVKHLSKNDNDRTVISTQFEGFAYWVDSIHNYRHGQIGDGYQPPSMDLCISILTIGTSLLRTLCQISLAEQSSGH